MYFFFHLITGLVIGYALGDRFDNRFVVLACAVGAVLPDLVDKPLGHLILGEEIGNGRIFLHTLLFLLIAVTIGLCALLRKRSPHLVALGVGVGSHQVLDLMWEQPREWFYPLLGSFTPLDHEDWFLEAFIQELQNPAEWVSFFLLCILLLPIGLPAIGIWINQRFGGSLRRIALISVPVLILAGLYVLQRGLREHYTVITGWDEPLYNVLGGVVVIIAGFAAWRFSKRSLPLGSPEVAATFNDQRQ